MENSFKRIHSCLLCLLMIWTTIECNDSKVKLKYYNLWQLKESNFTTFAVLQYPKQHSADKILQDIEQRYDPSGCQFLSPRTRDVLTGSNDLQRLKCDMLLSFDQETWQTRSNSISVPLITSASEIHIDKQFSKTYRVKDIIVDLDISSISAVSISIHTNNPDDQEDIKVFYGKGNKNCSRYFEHDPEDGECRNLTETSGFLHFQTKEVVAVKVAIRIYMEKPKGTLNIRDIIVYGRCDCSIHSTGCVVERTKGSGRSGKVDAFSLECKCKDGYCNNRCSGYMDKKFNTGRCIENVKWRSRRKRRACSCSPSGTLYGLCHPLVSLGNACLCRRNFVGKYCNKCANGFFGYPSCKNCICNTFGSRDSLCNQDTGKCRCRHLLGLSLTYEGRTCNECPDGYFGFPTCQACKCASLKNAFGTCDRNTGQCTCGRIYTGPTCNKCKPGFYSYPSCVACNCSTPGALSTNCTDSGVCQCKKEFSGPKCNKCAAGFKSYPFCFACGCSKAGSRNSSCHTTTGQCYCKAGFTGLNCESCKDSSSIYPQCMEKCYCNKIGVLYHNAENTCGTKEGSCSCKEFVTGRRCDKCKPLFYNLTKENLSGCDFCSCAPAGTIGGLRTCRQQSGQCLCKRYVTGRRCNQCKIGYYGLSSSKLLGCEACKCDTGGSKGFGCDIYGTCKCKTGVTGSKCNRLSSGLLYIPSLYDLRFELEEGKTLHEAPVRFRYNYAEFPNFSWRGYITLGVSQSVVVLGIDVPKTSTYQIALKYVLREDAGVTCVVRVKNKKDPKIFQYGIAVMKSSLNKLSKPQHALVSNGEDGFILNKGEWELIISSTATGLLLDFAVLIPDEYFNVRSLEHVPIEPCSIGQKPQEPCEAYKFLPLDGKNGVKVEAENAYTGDKRQSKRRRSPDVFIDPDVLTELKSNGMAVFSFRQKILNFDIKAKKDGGHFLVVSFFNPDVMAYRVQVYVDQDYGFVEMSSCTLRFVCRVVILDIHGAPKAFYFNTNAVKTAIFIANVAGTLALDSVTAIPEDEWAEDYIKPSVYCIVMNGVCTKPASYPEPKMQVQLQPDHTNPADPLTGSVHATHKSVIVYGARLAHHGGYSLVCQYYQPKHPGFDMKGTINEATSIAVNMHIKFCPSTTGCRLHQKFRVSSFNVTITLEIPQDRDFWIDKMFLVPDDEFLPEILVPKTVRRSQIFTDKCFNDYVLPIEKPLKSFCKDSMFSLSLKFNNGPKSCRCSALGSRNRDCERYGGQCKCRLNIVGRRCERCRTGYYRYPYCRPCRCFTPGSLTPDCSASGQCKCRPQFGGWRCTRCNSVGYYGFPECKPCLCDREGSLSTFCRGSNGQCQCRINFEGRTCNKCRVGYHSYPECRRCKCTPAGIIVTPENPTGCPNKTMNRCLCKKNVEGSRCERCKTNFYSMQVSNPLGCSPCRCNVKGTVSGLASCDQSNGRCFCKAFVGGRTCDECLDGYYGLLDTNIFGCKACNCNPGGSLDTTCDKKTGQCKCRPNIEGRRCDRISDSKLYIPTLHHITSKPLKSTEFRVRGGDKSGTAELGAAKASSQHFIDVPRIAVFFLVLKYSHRLLNDNDLLTIDIKDSVTNEKIFSHSLLLEPRSGLSANEDQFLILKDKVGMLELRLSERRYWVSLYYDKTALNVHHVAVVPREYYTGDVLKKHIFSPCTVEDPTSDCLQFAFLPVPRPGVFTIEAESVRQNQLDIVELKQATAVNFNGAVTMTSGETLNIPVNGDFNDSYVVVFQYHSQQQQGSKFTITAMLRDKLDLAYGTFGYCPYTFGCRQAAVDKDGNLKKFNVSGVSKSWSLSLTINNGNVSLDLITIVPHKRWGIDFIRPTKLCVSREGKCVANTYDLPEKTYFLRAEDVPGLTSQISLPPGVIGSSTKLVYLNKAKITLSWAVKLPRGRYVVILRYYQPNQRTFATKIIVSTPRRAVAGKFTFEYCPKATGCHGVLKDLAVYDQPFAIYISMPLLVVSISLPKGVDFWLDYVLLLPLYEFSDELLMEQPLDISKDFHTRCIDAHLRMKEPTSKFCENALFQLTTKYNNGPLKCSCNIQGSTSEHCSHVGGRCRCKEGISGEHCDQCSTGLKGFPFCRQPS